MSRGMMPIKLLSSDLDGTLLGDSRTTKKFFDAWSGVPTEKRPMLCYNSGRLVRDVLELLRQGHLPWPDYVIGGVGTEIFDCRRKRYLHAFQKRFRESWDRRLISRVMRDENVCSRQPLSFNHEFKSSWFVADASESWLIRLEQAMAEAGIRAQIVYSSQRDLDVIPLKAGKGEATRWLAHELQLPLSAAVVAGDSGNDVSMLELPSVRRIVVANAHPDLDRFAASRRTFRASSSFAAGVVEGLRFFGLL